MVFTDVLNEPTASIYGLKSVLSNDISPNFKFRGPCIVIYSYNKSQRDAPFLKFEKHCILSALIIRRH